jgi:hypothetical protein
MTITTTWAIAQLEHETADGFVFTAHWTVSAVSDVVKPGVEDEAESFYSAGAYGSIGFQRPDNLIPYENLTEEIVVGWVKEKLSEVSESEDPDAEPEKSQLQQIEEALAANIESQIHPTSESGVPW